MASTYREIPSITDVPRDPDANYEQEAYGDALRTAAFLFDPTEPMIGSEFRRGVINFLADAYAVSELETGIRMEQVERDLNHAMQVVWHPDGPAGEWEFKGFIRVPGTANGEAAARERAEALADEVSASPDHTLSIEDSEPSFEGGE